MSFTGAYADPYKCQVITSLGKGKDAQEAKALLEQIAKQVQPIMRQRQWTVNKLSEFSPRNPNLLGLNIGGGNSRYALEIKIRLRPASSGRNSNSRFYPYESLLVTMLHELTHIVHGPHNSSFYKLLDELKAQCETLMAKGISGTGQGFDAPSLGRLGQHSFIPQHNPPEQRAKDVMLKAAEERAKRQRIMSTGPQKLGGDRSLARTLSPAEAAAQAAERRARDNVWCPSEQLGQLSLEEVEAGTSNAAAANGTARDHMCERLGLGPGDTPMGGGVPQPSSSSVSAGPSAARASSSNHLDVQGVAGGNRRAQQQPKQASQQQQQQQQRQQQQQVLEQRQRQCLRPPKQALDTDAAPSAVVDLTEEDDAAAGPSTNQSAGPASRQQLKRPQAPLPAAHSSPGVHWQKPRTAKTTEASGAQQMHSAWTCHICTLLNRPLALTCEACMAERPM